MAYITPDALVEQTKRPLPVIERVVGSVLDTSYRLQLCYYGKENQFRIIVNATILIETYDPFIAADYYNRIDADYLAQCAVFLKSIR